MRALGRSSCPQIPWGRLRPLCCFLLYSPWNCSWVCLLLVQSCRILEEPNMLCCFYASLNQNFVALVSLWQSMYRHIPVSWYLGCWDCNPCIIMPCVPFRSISRSPNSCSRLGNWSRLPEYRGLRGLHPFCVCLVAQSCLTPCDPLDCSPPGSYTHGIF